MTAIKNRHDGHCQLSPISCTRVLQDPVVAIKPKSRLSTINGRPKCAIHKIINKQDDRNARSYRMFAPDRQHSQIVEYILPPNPQYRTTEMLDPIGCIAPDKRHSQYWNTYTIQDDRNARSIIGCSPQTSNIHIHTYNIHK